ncbi:MAG TPA: hypothetical protein DF715_10615, partial [Oceanicaulis sp.]|nr:hypothetical protein [Oceanicaulis sp.]
AARAEALRERIVAARTALRDVERGFRREIVALENRLQFWTIWIPPLLVIVLAVLTTLIRRRRRR